MKIKSWNIQIDVDGEEFDCTVFDGFDPIDVEIARSKRALDGRFQSTEVEGDLFLAVADDACRVARELRMDADDGHADYLYERMRDDGF